MKEELVDMMGWKGTAELTYSGFLTVIRMLVSRAMVRQTTCGKLAVWLKQNGKKPDTMRM